ncbi:hypothetical protein I5R92_24385 [Pseudomonas carnis]|uniref:Uncharacterized protein n=1 Tax=Pseudomonas haemolytica TaxID=2600065 RepID=A0ABS1H182_9PSED|nr:MULTISPECIES: hypothetical protein [Pseudomonas]MBH3370431.1 hypothetical protein [Pseudomonas carnis]MBK3451759.1 hypothetical protein [Pseudomonas haemolytica]MBK3462978.1 hypothetical protein [Pseudomonas haemolytica]MDE1532291.1 hypothetical protein [Pseudomonas carnis]
MTIIDEPGKDIPKTIYDQLGTTKNDIQINNQGEKSISTTMTNLQTFDARECKSITKDRVNDRSITAKMVEEIIIRMKKETKKI